MTHDDNEPPLTAAQLANEVRLLDKLLARELPLAARHALLEVRDRVQRELAVTEVVTRARAWWIETKERKKVGP
jgi:hypothetical protein